MSNNAEVSRCMQRLGGVYQDPMRVSRDASSLLNAQVGRHLRTKVSSYVQNNGLSTNALLIDGTIKMNYNGNVYNIPINIYIPPNYPILPPTAYVRPISSMMIKKDHRHVGADGMVYMPYFHNWKKNSHNLMGTCNQMSYMFEKEPPVFAKPAGHVSNSNYNGNPTPPPAAAAPAAAASPPTPFLPSYNDLKSKFGLGGSSGGNNKRQSEEERLAKEAEEANQVVAIARAAEEKEGRDKQLVTETRDRLTARSKQILETYKVTSRNETSRLVEDKILLEKSDKFLNGTGTGTRSSSDDDLGQIEYLNNRKTELEKYHDEVDENIAKLESFIESAEEAKKASKEVSVDELAVPQDIHSAQMLILSAENAAINDALFFLDKALADHCISMEDHLRAVRRLAKKQFLSRAHLLKVGQVKAAESIYQKSVW